MVLSLFKPQVQDESLVLDYSTGPQIDPHVPKYPIVLCHGFSGFDGLIYIPTMDSLPKSLRLTPDWIDQLKRGNPHSKAIEDQMNKDNQSIGLIPQEGKFLVEYWNGLKTHLESYHCKVLVARVPPFASIDTRAKALHHYILSQLDSLRYHYNIDPNERVKLNLIAHSMGGLDARYLINQYNDQYNKDYQVVSLSTLSTPHHGTSAADLVISLVPNSLLEKFFPSIQQLTPGYSKIFNEVVVNDPKVKYFSYGAAFTPSPANLFYLTWLYVKKNEGPNDGLISLKSAHWGKWMGYVPGIDHADLINWVGLDKHVQTLLGINQYPFQAKWMYTDIINNLAINGL